MNQKYIVKIDNLCSSLLEIEAESKELAREKAKDFFENNRNFVINLKDSYTSTTPPDLWPIIPRNEFEDLQKQHDAQSKAKEQASILIHRADLIDHRMRIRNRKTLMGTIEEYLLTKDLIEVEKRVEDEQIKLSDESRKMIDEILSEDIYNRKGIYKYMDPDAKPWKIADLIRAREQIEIRMRDNNITFDNSKSLENGENHLIMNEDNNENNKLEDKKETENLFLENRDTFTEEEYLEMARQAQEKAKALREHHKKSKGKEFPVPPKNFS